MASNGSPAVYGVLGYPAKHSLSPFMHQAAFTSLAITAEYRIFEIEPDNLEGFCTDVARRTLHGFNVTIPYKEQIIPLLDYVAPDARLIGAVNTVKVHSSRLEGFNTDGQGFMDDLVEHGCYPKAMNVCVIGAGGASRAVCFYLAKAAPAEIAVFDKDQHKAGHLISHLTGQFPKIRFRQAPSAGQLGIADAHLLINATFVGMKEDDPLLVEERFLHKDLFVYDVVYTPAETKLVKAAKASGCRAANGLGMLLHQGMRSFEIWTGIKPPRDVMEQALRKAIAS
jgi:shikimate dehydrogenase